MKFCEKCGHELREGSSFCGNCGEKINKEEIDLATEQTMATSNSKRWYQKKSLYILISSILFIAIVFTIIFINYNTINKELYKEAIALLEAIDTEATNDNNEASQKFDEFVEKYKKDDSLSKNDISFKNCVINTYYAKLLGEAYVVLHALDKRDSSLERAKKFALLYIQGKEAIKKGKIKDIEEYNNFYSYVLEEINEDSKEDPINNLEIIDGWTWDREGNYTYIRGRVKNIGIRNIRYFKVTAEYMDQNYNVLNTDFTNSAEIIKPGNQKEFEIMHRYNREYKKVRIFVEEVRFE